MSIRCLLTAGLILLLAGCVTTSTTAPNPPPAAQVGPPATIRGSEESSTLLDNFTAYIAAVDGQPVAAGRAGWNTPIELKAGHHFLAVEFRRGVFTATAQLELPAAPNTNYQLKYATDAHLFGRNSYCDFWITDLGTNQTVTGPVKAAVAKAN